MTSTDTPQPSGRPLMVMVMTRDIDPRSMNGRTAIAMVIQATLGACSRLTTLHLPNILTDPTPPRMASLMFGWLKGLLVGPRLPFQCALFQNSADHRRLIGAIPKDAAAVYLDGVRCYSFLVRLRRERPNLHIVVDFDDLMSRRMTLLLDNGQSLSPGYLTQSLPPTIRRIITWPLIGRAIVRFERGALTGIERRIADLADRVVLLSSEEAKIFEARLSTSRRAPVVVIPPSVRPLARPDAFKPPKRFVFIGSESQTQNRLTLVYLVDLWRRHRIKTPLLLVGYRLKPAPLPESVAAVGYLETLADVYDGESVLITPSFIGGGIKTKVLEAFANGAAVIGNSLTFESMPIGDYPLKIDDEDRLLALVSRPDRHQETFAAAAAAGAAYIRAYHDPETISALWREVMRPKPKNAA